MRTGLGLERVCTHIESILFLELATVGLCTVAQRCVPKQLLGRMTVYITQAQLEQGNGHICIDN